MIKNIFIIQEVSVFEEDKFNEVYSNKVITKIKYYLE